jgi:hypothetical protein
VLHRPVEPAAITGKVHTEPETDSIWAMSTKPLFDHGWEVSGIISAQKFFSALPEILALPANLCFEGTSISPDVQSFFASHAASQILQIPPGTIWPKPSVFHVRATEQSLHQLASLAERHAEPEICDHFHAYDGNQGLMQWYDAFSGDPLLVDESVGEMKVQAFCRKLGVSSAPWRAGNKPPKS